MIKVDEYYKHDTALVYGEVEIGEGSSLWPYTVIRSENNHVSIGKYTNIQDFVMIHVGSRTPTIIGDYCSITHRSIIHGATIGDNCLIGIGVTIMDGCKIGNNCIISDGAYLKERTVIPDNTIVEGSLGEKRRTRNNYVMNKLNAHMYAKNAVAYNQGNYRVWSEQQTKDDGYALIQRFKEEMKLQEA